MMNSTNSLGQPIGHPVDDWSIRPRPPRTAMEGRFTQVEPLDPDRHAADLHAANLKDTTGANWTYLAYGPFGQLEEYFEWMKKTCLGDDPMFHAIVDQK